jgi:hypothetical protein
MDNNKWIDIAISDLYTRVKQLEQTVGELCLLMAPVDEVVVEVPVVKATKTPEACENYDPSCDNDPCADCSLAVK